MVSVLASVSNRHGWCGSQVRIIDAEVMQRTRSTRRRNLKCAQRVRQPPKPGWALPLTEWERTRFYLLVSYILLPFGGSLPWEKQSVGKYWTLTMAAQNGA